MNFNEIFVSLNAVIGVDVVTAWNCLKVELKLVLKVLTKQWIHDEIFIFKTKGFTFATEQNNILVQYRTLKYSRLENCPLLGGLTPPHPTKSKAENILNVLNVNIYHTDQPSI